MVPLILIGLIAGVPVILAFLLRVSAVFLLLSVLIGDAFVKFLSDDVVMALSGFIKSPRLPMIVQISLLLLPVVMTLVVLRKSLQRSQMLFHILPLIFTGLTLAVLALPLMTSGVQGTLFNTPAGNIIKNAQDLIIGCTGLLILTLVWHTYKHRPDKKHHNK